MTQRSPGWYPDPEFPDSTRWWNGTEWTEESLEASTHAPNDPGQRVARNPRRRPKIKWIAFGGGGMALLIGAFFLGWLFMPHDGVGQDAAAVGQSSSGSQTKKSPEKRFSQPGQGFDSEGEENLGSPTVTNSEGSSGSLPSTKIPLGQKLVSKNFAITIHSAEVVDELETSSGPPLHPEPGTQIVYVHATYKVLGDNGVDLTCANYDSFITGYDNEGGEMSNFFVAPRLAGNPECNTKLLTGQSTDWYFAYKIVDGRTPAYIEVIDTNYYGEDEWGDPVDLLLD